VLLAAAQLVGGVWPPHEVITVVFSANGGIGGRRVTGCNNSDAEVRWPGVWQERVRAVEGGNVSIFTLL